MKEDRPDPRHEKLIALLYGELSGAEAESLRREMAGDPALAAEFEELGSTRALLGAEPEEEPLPSFVIVDREAVALPRMGPWDRVREALAGPGAGWRWAFAAAAAALVVLLARDLRIETKDGGLAFVFGRPASGPVSAMPNVTGHDPVEREPEVARTMPSGLEPDGTPRPDSRGEDRAAPPPDRAVPPVDLAGDRGTSLDRPTPVQRVSAGSGASEYMSREEFEQYQAGLLRMVVTLLNDYNNRRDVEFTTALQSLYNELNDRRYRDYRELNGRIEAVGLGLISEQSRTRDLIFEMLPADSTAIGAPDDSTGQDR